MSVNFYLDSATSIRLPQPATEPVRGAAAMLRRDMRKVLRPGAAGVGNQIVLRLEPQMAAETFSLSFAQENDGEAACMLLHGADELGLIYGLLFISEKYLGVPPFWFWNDAALRTMDRAVIPAVPYRSKPCRVRYRGWFVNDEMLLLGWKDDPYAKEVWQPVFEALLRCGGNMVIPGTGQTSRHLERLAVDMGLIITHHHAEPLGAELFLSAYPDKEPSYQKNAPLFEALWKKAILRQRDHRVVWGLGFRGQGDAPFWNDDPAYDTPQARGGLISEVIRRQYDLLCQYVDHPVCCTNLYGELMQLYRDGCLSLPEGVIKVWADNGYGKMVSRRQGNDNPRIPSLPQKQDRPPHGLYYHVSFHDLQASNHITMLPNDPRMVADELHTAFEAGADTYLILNCGSVKPHIYLLDLVAELWRSGAADVQAHLRRYADTYFDTPTEAVGQCFREYFRAAVRYGAHADERAGEQFYHYPARNIVSHWMQGNAPQAEGRLVWAAGSAPFAEQVEWFAQKYTEGKENWGRVHAHCAAVRQTLAGRDRQRFDDTLMLQSMLHLSGCEGGLALCTGYAAFARNDVLRAYLYANKAMRAYQKGAAAMAAAAHDGWAGIYRNDCLTNVRLTVWFMDALRRYLRVLGDGGEWLDWERRYLLPESLKRVMLETTYTSQLPDDELYERLTKLEAFSGI